ncbi:MAG TPA: YhfZ family protein [Candidatus Limnocylindrales bacterium]|nr:YhfZ family protein [Candidatus Limnocylindrales bacterium]
MVTSHARSSARAVTDVVAELAGRFLTADEPPARLPTIRELAQDHGSSLSSIHAAIGRLEEAGAITIETRGRLGAFMVERSVGRLWAIAENGPLVISLPLASSPRYEALATALKQLLTNAGLEVFLIFVRGSRQRLQTVREGRCHLTVMSRFAASELCGPEDSVVVELAPESYNTGHRVFYLADNPDPHPVRVIVDRHSADQQLLTALEFSGADVTLVPAMPAQITRLLASGQADAAVWTIDEMQVGRPEGILDRPLRPEVRQQIGDRMTRAVLVGRAANAALLRAVTTPIQSAAVAQIQLDVMAGRVVPEY